MSTTVVRGRGCLEDVRLETESRTKGPFDWILVPGMTRPGIRLRQNCWMDKQMGG